MNEVQPKPTGTILSIPSKHEVELSLARPIDIILDIQEIETQETGKLEIAFSKCDHRWKPNDQFHFYGVGVYKGMPTPVIGVLFFEQGKGELFT